MTELIFEDCKVDLMQQRVIRARNSCGLTTMERRLLAYLASRRNRVISRASLLTDVWEYDPKARWA